MSKHRVIVLSSPEFANRRQLILNELRKQGVPVFALVVSSYWDSLIRRISIFWKRLRKYRLSFILDDLLSSKIDVARLLCKDSNENIRLSVLYQNIVKVPSFQTEAGAAIIKRLSPDLIILAGTLLLPERILSIPKLGTINGHLGVTPYYRGNYPVLWARYNRDPIGITVHWVDAGLDTGPVISQKIVTLPEKNIRLNLKELVQIVEKEGARFLASAVRDIVTEKIDFNDAKPQELQKGFCYKYMPPKLQRQLRHRLNEFKELRELGKSSKKVLITTQVFPPEIHPTAFMVKELAEQLARQGMEITVAAGFPHHPYGRLYSGYRKRWIWNEKNDGFRVVRGWHLISPCPALIPRTLVLTSQCAGFVLDALNSHRPDLVISYGPPLIGPLTSGLIAGATGAKLINVIYDIYPDILIEMGKLQNPVLIRAARKLERLIYCVSDRIVVLSEGFSRKLIQEKGLDPNKVAVIPVWLNGRDIAPMARDNPWRREMGIGPEKFVVLYAGTIGLVSGAEVVIEVASRLKDYPDILFLMVGAGQAKDRIEAKARKQGLQNLRFLPFQPRERLKEVQACADVSLVTLAPGRGKTSVPSKVLGYMAAARPVIAAVDTDCDTAELIRRAECGQVTPPGQREELAEAVSYYYRHPKDRESAGLKGRQYFLKHLEKEVVLKQYVELVEKLG